MNSPIASNDMPGRRSLAPWIIGGLVALVLLILVGGTGALLWYGVGLFNDQAATAIRADPAVTDALGTISEIRLDFTATGNAPGAEEFAYRVVGERGSGLLIGRFVTIDADHEDLRSGTLRLDSGKVVAVGTPLSGLRGVSDPVVPVPAETD
jgi:hypothetical protein